ncbi:NACHT domain-containing protein [Streptosporangium sp. NPDC049046]|uniref:NACHT domain-containing protein n=1 Tax=Streptosporangium sp. NPDC049046 TaxID=3155031 RepID=UPI003420C497
MDFVLRSSLTRNITGAATKGSLGRIVDYFCGFTPSRLVITGDPGSGKTVLVIELILALLKGRADNAPVPVRLSAAALDTSRPPETAVREWLIGHLIQTYQVPKSSARALVAARMVLPVIDGLDEMDTAKDPSYASRGAQTVRACNAYLDGAAKASMVLTCRSRQYQALEKSHEWVREAAHVELRPVGLPKARAFLSERVSDDSRWQSVLTAMRRGGNRPLAAALSTPWRLTLAAMVYDQRDPETGAYLRDPGELTMATLDTQHKIRDHLLSLLIPAVTTVNRSPYSAHHVHRWLSSLARYLNANTPTESRPIRMVGGRPLSAYDLALHELWPLAGVRLPRALTAIFSALPSFALGIYVYSTSSPRPEITKISVSICFMLIQFCITWTFFWPSTYKIRLPSLLTPTGRLRVTLGIALGLIGGLASAVLYKATGDALNWLTLTLGSGLGGGLSVGLIAGLMARDYSPTRPHKVAGSSIVAGLASGLAIGLMLLLIILPTGKHEDLTTTLAVGLFAGLTLGFLRGLAGWRYVALLLCTRRWNTEWLPWRLGIFLDRCYKMGLIRIAGSAYQFRHRELQEYLARLPAA